MDTLEAYLTKLASAEPTPGGGSAAMVSGALACALVAMVSRILHADDLAGQADALRARMMTLRERDEKAFAAVVAAKGDRGAVQDALLAAAAAPLDGAAAAVEALELCALTLALKNRHLVSDIGCAAEFARAALSACSLNVRINHKYIKGENETVTEQRKRLAVLQLQGRELFDAIFSAVSQALER